MAMNLQKCLENMSALIRGWKLEGMWVDVNGAAKQAVVWMHATPEGQKLVHMSFPKENGALGVSFLYVHVDSFLKSLSSLEIAKK